jgi:thymidine kinase
MAKKKGSIEVITGPMFSGKTEELIRRVARADIAKIPYVLFKPMFDTRYSENEIVSHDNKSLSAKPVMNAKEILGFSIDAEIIGIDEAQFFNQELIDTCVKLANGGVRVIVAGLDMDYLSKPFQPIPNIIGVADQVTKLKAICVECGDDAGFTHRIDKKEEKQLMLGEKNAYEPLCRTCFKKYIKV